MKTLKWSKMGANFKHTSQNLGLEIVSCGKTLFLF